MLTCKVCLIDMDDLGCYSKCPKCGLEESNVEIYARVVGFITPIKQWHKGKKEEFKDRKTYKIPRGIKEDIQDRS